MFPKLKLRVPPLLVLFSSYINGSITQNWINSTLLLSKSVVVNCLEIPPKLADGFGNSLVPEAAGLKLYSPRSLG